MAFNFFSGRFFTMGVWLPLAMALGACGSGRVLSEAEKSAVIVAECKLYARAKVESVRLGAPLEAIDDGCPGATARQSAAGSIGNFTSAVSSGTPPDITKFGPAGEDLYRRMIARGASQSLATAMTATPEFAEAAALLTKARAPAP